VLSSSHDLLLVLNELNFFLDCENLSPYFELICRLVPLVVLVRHDLAEQTLVLLVHLLVVHFLLVLGKDLLAGRGGAEVGELEEAGVGDCYDEAFLFVDGCDIDEYGRFGSFSGPHKLDILIHHNVILIRTQKITKPR